MRRVAQANADGYVVLGVPAFFDCVRSIRRDDQYADDLPEVIAELERKPFRNLQLRTHPLQGVTRAGRRVYASDVGGRRSDRRVVWQVVNRTIVLLLYGSHAIYERVKRMRIDLGDNLRPVLPSLVASPVETGAIESGATPEQPYHHRRREVGSLFILWDDAELNKFGLPPTVVQQLRRLNSEDEFDDLRPRLAEEHAKIALNLRRYCHPDGEQPEPEVLEADEPETTAEDLEMERRLLAPDSGRWFKRIDPPFMAEILRKPIEDWMIYLHPDQEGLVEQTHRGLARVRGPAGTGKTVVGLHRARFLARRDREAQQCGLAGTGDSENASEGLPVLFTSWMKSLPPVLEALYLRMPGTRKGEVEFIHTDGLASRLCEEAGDELAINVPEAKRLFSDVCRASVVPGTPLGDSGLSKRYLKAEVDKVIKVQDLGSLEDYLELKRVGRSAPLDNAQRQQLWEIVEQWDADKTERGLMDVCDLIPRALVHARRLQAPRYSAAIVDEAQDLTLVGLQLVRAVVNAPYYDTDGTDRLMLLGDAAQRIYEGGFTLDRVGSGAAGRSITLDENYRNTAEVIDAAMAVAGDVRVEDFDDTFRRGDETAAPQRQGPKPVLVAATGLDAQLDYILARTDELTSADRGYGPGDIGILVKSRADVDAVLRRLRRQGHRCQNLEGFQGKTSDTIKVGTYQRGKGLEFKAVFLPQVTDGKFPAPPTKGMNEQEATEERDRQIALLFVAMTRARDLLFVLHDNKPSEPVAAAVERFDAIDTRQR